MIGTVDCVKTVPISDTCTRLAAGSQSKFGGLVVSDNVGSNLNDEQGAKPVHLSHADSYAAAAGVCGVTGGATAGIVPTGFSLTFSMAALDASSWAW